MGSSMHVSELYIYIFVSAALSTECVQLYESSGPNVPDALRVNMDNVPMLFLQDSLHPIVAITVHVSVFKRKAEIIH